MQYQDDFFTKQDEFSEQTGTTVHIRLSQRNGRKTLTTVEGLQAFCTSEEMKELSGQFRRTLHTGGSVVNKDGDTVILLNGDKRILVAEVLRKRFPGSVMNVIMHGV